MDIYSNLANICYALAYVLRNIMVLRILVILGGIIALPYLIWAADEPLWPEIQWKFVFIGINVVWVRRLWLERQPVDLTKEQERLYLLAFRTLTPREMLELLDAGAWEDAEPGTRLVGEGESARRVSLIVDGHAVASGADIEVEMGPGDFVGSAALMSDDPVPAPGDVRAQSALRTVSWATRDLLDFTEGRPQLVTALQAAVGGKLIHAIQRIRPAGSATSGSE